MSDIRETVRMFVLDSFVPDVGSTTLSDDTNLKDSGILDSFSTLNLVTFIEDRFQIQLESADLESGSLLSINSIEKLVVSRRGLPQ